MEAKSQSQPDAKQRGNTRFFHLSAKIEDALTALTNCIDSITKEGSLLEDPEQIRDHAVEFYSNLFKTLPKSQDVDFFNLKGPSVSERQNVFLPAVPSPSEIKGVFSLKKTVHQG